MKENMNKIYLSQLEDAIELMKILAMNDYFVSMVWDDEIDHWIVFYIEIDEVTSCVD